MRLRRHGVGNLRELRAAAREAAGDADKPAKSFKDYEPARRYLFVAIDRATRWVFVRVYADQGEAKAWTSWSVCTRRRRGSLPRC